MDATFEMASNHAHLLSKRSLETMNHISGSLSDQTLIGALARGKMFELVGYFDEASASYAQGIAYDSSSDEASARLALTQLKAGHFQEGLATATKLAARKPDFQIQALATNETVSAITILADALVLNHRLKDAVIAYEKARKFNPEDSYAAGRLAEIHIVHGEPEKALALAKDFADNPRFKDLTGVLGLGKTSASLLPHITTDSLIARLRSQMPGRPMVVGSEIRLATLIEGDDTWCKL